MVQDGGETIYESDFMIGDEKMMEEWRIGTKVGSSILNIIESGNIEGSAYVPYDDEGTKDVYYGVI